MTTKFKKRIVKGKTGLANLKITLQAIKWYIEKYDEPPTGQELAELLGITLETTYTYLRKLKQMRYISVTFGTPRSIVIL